MTLLVTGATGFVMSVVARHWLEANPDERLVVLDAALLDAAAQQYFAPFKQRMKVVTADVTRPEQWRDALRGEDIRNVVHGATVTPISRGSAVDEITNSMGKLPPPGSGSGNAAITCTPGIVETFP